MRRLQERFAASGVAAEFIVVTLDPDADTTSVLHQFRSTLSLPYSLHLLRGDSQATEEVAALLDIHILPMSEHLIHDARIAVFTPDGRLTRRFECCDFDEADAVSAVRERPTAIAPSNGAQTPATP
jgi:hypothetical protein